jgi:hypothetical protein
MEQPSYLPDQRKMYSFLEDKNDEYHKDCPDLLRLAKQCLAFNPADRPTFVQLQAQIDAKFAGQDEADELLNYVHLAREGIQPLLSCPGGIDLFQEKGRGYRVGMAFEGASR